jgi:hypothetical protein
LEISIRPLHFEKDREAVFKLYGTVFGADSLANWKKRWRWEYIENPAVEYVKPVMWVAEREDGVIVGVHGGYPEKLKINTAEISTIDPGDLAVYVEARRQGLGEKLTKAYMDNEKYITLAYNYAAATGRIFRRLGLIPVDCVPRYLRTYDLEAIFHFLLDSRRAPSWIGKKPLVYLFAFGSKVLNFILLLVNHLKRPKISKKYVVEEVKVVGSEFDDLWREISPLFPIIFVRNAKFIQWRFLEDPCNKHTLLAVRDKNGALRGYIDIMFSKKKKMLVGRIMDLFCTPGDNEIVDALLAKAFDIFEQRRVAFITCMGLHPLIRKRVMHCLYSKPSALQDPGLLNWKGDSKLQSFVQDSKNWHLSYADGDIGFFSLGTEN